MANVVSCNEKSWLLMACFRLLSLKSIGGKHLVHCNTNISSHCITVQNITLNYLFGFFISDSQKNKVSKQESSDILSVSKSENLEDTKEPASQKQTENLTVSIKGMAVYCFISLLLKTEHHVFLEYGRWPSGHGWQLQKKILVGHGS